MKFNKFIEQFNSEISDKRKYVLSILTNFPDLIIDSPVNVRDTFDNQNIKASLYFQVLNTLIHEFNNRFPKESLTLKNACTSLYYCNYEFILHLLEMYN